MIALEGYLQTMISAGIQYDEQNETKKGYALIALILIMNLFITPVGLIHSIINNISIYQ